MEIDTEEIIEIDTHSQLELYREYCREEFEAGKLDIETFSQFRERMNK